MEPLTPHAFENPGGKDKPYDGNDILLGAAGLPVYTHPAKIHNAEAWASPVEYQQDQPACGAHSGSKAKGLALGKRFSPRFNWGDIKTFDGFPIDAGTDIRSIFKSITKSGALAFEEYGNATGISLKDYAKAPTLTMYALAKPNGGQGYGFIKDLSFRGLKQFISDNGPAIILLRLGKDWWTKPSGGNSWAEKDILPLRVPKTIVSGHFVVAHSFDEDYIYFINSWSAS